MLRLLFKFKASTFLVTTIAVSASACMTAWKRLDVPPGVDLSTSDKSAVIRGSRSGMNGLDCYISQPSRTRELIMDSGTLVIRAECYSWGGQLGESIDIRSAELTFDAQQGHEYKLVGFSTCMGCGKRSKLGHEHVDLIDKTDESRLIARQRLSK